jgi:hypothetical protein
VSQEVTDNVLLRVQLVAVVFLGVDRCEYRACGGIIEE